MDHGKFLFGNIAILLHGPWQIFLWKIYFMDHVNFFYCIMANLLHEPWQFIFSYHGKIASWTMSKLLKNP